MMANARLFLDRTGSAAAEFALILPMLLVLMFGTFELGHFFLSEHVVQKSVRDAARYAARLPMASYPGCDPTPEVEEQIQRIARAGDPDGDWDNDGTADQRLQGWTDDTMTTVTLTCDTSGTYTGMYTGFPTGVPVITVSAQVPYPTLFSTLGLGTGSFNLRAESQAAVFGA